MHTWLFHACRNSTCKLWRLPVGGSIPGHCPKCGWVRVLALIVTRRH